MADVNDLARSLYARGKDPIDWAVSLVVAQIDARDSVVSARLEIPGAYPGYLLDLDDESVARRIIGALLDAGWTAPTPKGN